MSIFGRVEALAQSADSMAKTRKTRVDDAKVSAWVVRLEAEPADRAAFEAALAELVSDPAVSAADLVAVAHRFNKGGKKPTSRVAAVALIRKRFVEIARFHAKNKVAAKARPW
jgi:hypothetical protein